MSILRIQAPSTWPTKVSRNVRLNLSIGDDEAGADRCCRMPQMVPSQAEKEAPCHLSCLKRISLDLRGWTAGIMDGDSLGGRQWATSPMSEASGVRKGGREKVLFGCCCPSDVGSGCASMKMGISAADIYGVLMAALTREISQIFYINALHIRSQVLFGIQQLYEAGPSASSSPFILLSTYKQTRIAQLQRVGA